MTTSKVWLLVGDTYECATSHAVFKDKPTREQLTDFIVDHYYKADGSTREETLTGDYTIRSHTWDWTTGWSSKVRNFDQYLDDILEMNNDSNDGEDYGTYFALTEMDLQ